MTIFEWLLGVAIAIVGVELTLLVWYLRKVVKEVFMVWGIISEIAQEQGWIEEVEENRNPSEEEEDCYCEDCEKRRALKELTKKHEAFAKLYIL